MKLSVNLYKKKDSNNRQYHIGHLKFPGTLSLKNGIAFIVYTSVPGIEELHICNLDNLEYSNIFNYYSNKDKKIQNNSHNISAKLVPKKEIVDPSDEDFGYFEPKTFYVGKIDPVSIVLHADEGLTFFVFTSEVGKEEIQISKKK